MTATELLPCPFCGGKNVKLFSLDEDCEVVSCDDCNGQGGYFSAPDSTGPDEAIAAWNRRTLSPEVAALIADARREWCKKLDRIADEIDEQVKVTRAYVGDCGMDHNQKELMKICTSHFLDKARDIRALKEATHD